MKNNKGVTIVNMMIIIIVIIIISSVSIIGGRRLLEDSKASKMKENLSAVKSAVNSVSIKLGTAGTLTPANVKLYGKVANTVLSGDSELTDDWYVLTAADLEDMGITYLDEEYLVNYVENEVVTMKEYMEKGI